MVMRHNRFITIFFFREGNMKYNKVVGWIALLILLLVVWDYRMDMAERRMLELQTNYVNGKE